jgi:hypothetical protein
MYFVYDLRRDGFVVYTGLTTDPGRSLSRHLSLGKGFDSLHIVERVPRLEDAKLAAQRRRYMLGPQRPLGQPAGAARPLGPGASGVPARPWPRASTPGRDAGAGPQPAPTAARR